MIEEELLDIIVNDRKQLQEKIKERVDKNQREYYLKEQLRIIKEELGVDEDDE